MAVEKGFYGVWNINNFSEINNIPTDNLREMDQVYVKDTNDYYIWYNNQWIKL